MSLFTWHSPDPVLYDIHLCTFDMTPTYFNWTDTQPGLFVYGSQLNQVNITSDEIITCLLLSKPSTFPSNNLYHLTKAITMANNDLHHLTKAISIISNDFYNLTRGSIASIITSTIWPKPPGLPAMISIMWPKPSTPWSDGRGHQHY